MCTARIGFGAAFIMAPEKIAKPWIGNSATTVGTQLMTRSMGIRDAVLGVGLLQALQQHDNRAASTWLNLGAAAGVVDSASTITAFPHLTRSGRAFLSFIAAATISDAVLARAISR